MNSALPGRINVVGVSGSGKTWFSKRLAEKMAVPYVEMDALFWGENWRWPEDEEFFGKLEAPLAGDAWVLDGNYSRSQPVKWRRVELVIWLDYSFARTTWQAVARAIRRAWSGEELWPGTGNRESFRRAFLSRDSIILWSVRNHGKVRRRYRKMMEEGIEGVEFLRLGSRGEVEGFLRMIEAE